MYARAVHIFGTRRMWNVFYVRVFQLKLEMKSLNVARTGGTHTVTCARVHFSNSQLFKISEREFSKKKTKKKKKHSLQSSNYKMKLKTISVLPSFFFFFLAAHALRLFNVLTIRMKQIFENQIWKKKIPTFTCRRCAFVQRFVTECRPVNAS